MIFMFFVHQGWKIVPVLYIYPSTGTENNTERSFSSAPLAFRVHPTDGNLNLKHKQIYDALQPLILICQPLCLLVDG